MLKLKLSKMSVPTVVEVVNDACKPRPVSSVTCKKTAHVFIMCKTQEHNTADNSNLFYNLLVLSSIIPQTLSVDSLEGERQITQAMTAIRHTALCVHSPFFVLNVHVLYLIYIY